MVDVALQVMFGWPGVVVGESLFLLGLIGRRWTAGLVGLGISATFLLYIGLYFPVGMAAAATCLTPSALALVPRSRAMRLAWISIAIPSPAALAYLASIVLQQSRF